MPKSLVAFTTKYGPVAFSGKTHRRSRRSPSQIRARMKKLNMSPKMIANALAMKRDAQKRRLQRSK